MSKRKIFKANFHSPKSGTDAQPFLELPVTLTLDFWHTQHSTWMTSRPLDPSFHVMTESKVA